VSLNEELHLARPIEVREHEAVLSIYYTAALLKKRADEFFHGFGITDVQFNVLMLLVYQSGQVGGLTQAQIGGMMLVNRANITTLIDRMEKAKLVIRTAANGDRRSNIVKITARGKKIYTEVEPLYQKLVGCAISPLSAGEQKKIILALERIRAVIM
jgi:DNA-binding MarR family transcriptional regulator